MKTGVQNYLKRSAAADFRGNDKKGVFSTFTLPSEPKQRSLTPPKVPPISMAGGLATGSFNMFNRRYHFICIAWKLRY